MSSSPAESRSPIWLALAELFLDTELDDAALERIAATLAASGLPREALVAIHEIEVAPVLAANLASVAGEWRGFDDAALAQRIAERLRRRSPLGRRLDHHSLIRWWRARATRDDLAGVLDRVDAIRRRTTAP
jgi:hypothetical protein